MKLKSSRVEDASMKTDQYFPSLSKLATVQVGQEIAKKEVNCEVNKAQADKAVVCVCVR